MANSFSFNNVDLGGSSYEFTLYPWSRPFMPGGVVPMSAVPYRNGAFAHDRWFGGTGKTFTLSGCVQTTTPTLVRTRLDNISRVLNEAEPKQLVLDYMSGRFLFAQVAGGMRSEKRGATAAHIEIDFVAADPHFYSTSLTTDAAQTNLDFDTPVAFNVASGAALGGSAIMEPTIYVRPQSGAGTISSISVTCSPGGQTLVKTSAGFAAGATNWFRLHCGLKRFQTSTNGSGTTPGTTWTDAMANVSGNFPVLVPGVVNTISVDCGVASHANNAAVVEYRIRYV
jgi:hypothetical protein